MGPGAMRSMAGCVGGLGQGGRYARTSSHAEWDQEPWVHEKHGGVRGGLGEGESGKGWRGAGCVGGGGRASGPSGEVEGMESGSMAKGE